MGVKSTDNLLGKWDAWRNLLPMLVLIVFAFVQQVPTRIPELSYMTPSLVIAGLFYWCIYRVDLVPLLGIFVLGIFEDIMTNDLFGFHALIFLIISAVCRWHRRFFYKQEFIVLWAGLSVLVLGISILKWLLYMIVHTQLLSYYPLLFSALATIFIYPIVALLMSIIHNRLPESG